MTTKVCVRCGSELNLSCFYIKKNGRPHSWCNECRRDAKKKWDSTHIIHRRAYKLNNKDREREMELKRRQADPQKYIDRYTRQNEKNKEIRRIDRQSTEFKNKRRAYEKKWRTDNIDYIYQYAREYYDSHPDKKIARSLSNRLRKLVKGKINKCRAEELVGCSYIFLRNHLESQFDDKMTWGNHGTYWHIDHIIPCAKFNMHDIEEQRKCFHWTNLRPLEASENISKNAWYDGVNYKYKK